MLVAKNIKNYARIVYFIKKCKIFLLNRQKTGPKIRIAMFKIKTWQF